MKTARSILLSMALVLSVPSVASSEAIEGPAQILLMPLEQLLELEVSVASRLPQSIVDVPSNVTVISRRQLQNWNISSLWELMGRVAGVLPLIDRDQMVMGVRGFVSGNTRGVLVLINGQPFYDHNALASRGIESPVLDPDLIEQVEMLRGPGGLVWNGNPLLAVINVKMRKASDSGGAFHLSDGTEETRGASLVAGLRGGKWYWNFNASAYESSGTAIHSETSINPNNDRIRLQADYNNQNPPFGQGRFLLGHYEPSYSLWTQAESGNVTLQGFYMHYQGNNRQQEIDQGRNLIEELNRGFINASYRHQFADNDQLELATSYSQHNMDWYGGEKSEATLSHSWRSTQNNYSIKYDKKWREDSVLVVADYTQGDLGPNIFNSISGTRDILSEMMFDQRTLSLQYTKRFADAFSTVFGAKWSRSHMGDVVSYNADPQLAVIWSPKVERTFKLAYNQASLRPDAAQVWQGLDENVEDQNVTSIDAIWYEQLSDEWTSTLNLYQMELEDRVTQREVGGIKSYGSIGNMRSRGLEYELAAQYDWGRFIGNLSLNDTEFLGGAPRGVDPDVLRFDERGNGLSYPELMVNLGVDIQYAGMTISPFIRYYDRVRIRTLSAADSVTGTAEYRNLPSSMQVDIHINYAFTSTSSISFYGNNVFDEQDEVATTVFNGVSEQYGKFFRLELIYKY